MCDVDDESCLIVTSDAQTFRVLRSVAKMSSTLDDLLKEVASCTTESNGIPLQSIDSKTFTKVVQYCTHHVSDPVEVVEAASAASAAEEAKPLDMSSWDKEFCGELDQEQQFAIILAANYLNIKPLLTLMCQSVAAMVSGKTPQQIYRMFKVEKELTPEEEAEVLKENPWLEDQ